MLISKYQLLLKNTRYQPGYPRYDTSSAPCSSSFAPCSSSSAPCSLTSADSRRQLRPKKVYPKAPDNYTEILIKPKRKVVKGANDKWGKPRWCGKGQFVREIGNWQYKGYWDDKGLTAIDIQCEPAIWPNNTVPPQYYVKSGYARGHRNYPKPCDESPIKRYHNGTRKLKRYLTGVQVSFGGRYYGATEIIGWCHLPDFLDLLAKLPYMPDAIWIHNSLKHFQWENNVKEQNWELSDLYHCEQNEAVCGINTKEGPLYWFKQEVGVTEVKIYCCPFPDIPL